ncbi:putative IQ motif, EF-hand binding, P-loop containing nucleoside triphosphate hydrolase [Helianthus annuus]|uniref:IQ motif, EF-hand binding, P-loop containing nucleoside triphosphate hydrolase n=1 Tax=Helianthus annuus TaxID=4232 RepID=A0A251VR38_HELAN|nr:myosin-4 [Helianthus annuus]KAF5822444.1 putative IQ motif, EF-hand binding, P-loop containing nucleoside triphosphate hydrolase [Helianthus annuus]KAJ0611913.1 putative IQ motif, EF-hand binding, P-loop containing nucleoside triphosphate hydrolase [Helianthus annuus]KAJ0627274.1 putative IQ motif, EF-hand binding, P-loop containing nucleoside triphosphate hydrolase [Helianthus annuus]KAJ0957304.1 putative IQ motif, EF-hand binding, P-loop containing nucleoside triphosphate hydrolase [Helian
MAALSTLELMLHDLQSKESLDHYGDHGKIPMLPQRPVSKARIPTNRARRAVLSFHMHEFGGKTKKEFVDSRSKRDGFEFIEGGVTFSKNLMKNGGEEKDEKGIIGIQKSFRGYQARSHYHMLKDAIITLQSFIRGEKARKEFQNSTKRCIQTHIDQEFVWKPLRNQETTIIYLQSVVRAWLSRRHLGSTGTAANKITKEAEELHEENIQKLEHVKVSQSYIRNLEQQVVKTEAALRHKERENSNLELQIQQIDRKWELHNAKMNSKEKIWQDEFTSIQVNLESTRETKSNEIIHFPQKPTRHQDHYMKTNLTIRHILELQENNSDFQVDNTLESRKGRKQELRKLKGRFRAWIKEFKARLHDVKKTLDRFEDGQTERVHKTCFHR